MSADDRPPWQDSPSCPKCKVAPATIEETDCGELRLPRAWCEDCGELTLPPADHARAVAAQAWWDRPDREQAWAELLRQREVDRIAAEHAARQTSLFPE